MKIKIVIALVAALVVGLFAWLLLAEKSRTEALTEELNRVRIEAGSVERDRSALQTEAKSLRSENEALSKEKQELRNLLTAAESDLTSTDRERSALQSQATELRAGREQDQAAAAKRLKEVEAVKADLKRAQTEAADLRKTLQTAQTNLKRTQTDAGNRRKVDADVRAGLEKANKALREELTRLQAGSVPSDGRAAASGQAVPPAAQTVGQAEGSWAGQPEAMIPGASAEAVPRTGVVNRIYPEALEAAAAQPESRAETSWAGQQGGTLPGASAEAVPRTGVAPLANITAPAPVNQPEIQAGDTAPGASMEAAPRTGAASPANTAPPEPTEANRAEYDRLQLAVTQAEGAVKAFKEQMEQAQGQLDDLRRDRDRLAGETEAARAEVKSTQANYDRLVTDLRAQIDSREVVISQLRDELSLTFLDSVFFAPAQASVTPDGARVLDALAKALRGRTDERLVVVGHTDDLPIAKSFRKVFPTNWELSSARAVAVLRYLTEKGGLDPTDLTAVGRSFYQPVAPNDSAANRQKNRRVEIIISPRARTLDLFPSAGESGKN